MDIKQELEDYKLNSKYVEEEHERIQEMLEQAQKITSQITNVHIKSSVNDRFAELLAKMIDMQTKLMQKIVQQTDKLNYITSLIDKLPQPHKNIIYSHYVQGKDLVIVACEIGYGYEWTCRLHGQALEMLKKLNKSY